MLVSLLLGYFPKCQTRETKRRDVNRSMSRDLVKSRCHCPSFSQFELRSKAFSFLASAIVQSSSAAALRTQHLICIILLPAILSNIFPQPPSLSSKFCEYALQSATASFYPYLNHVSLGTCFPCVDHTDNLCWTHASQVPPSKNWTKSPIPSTPQRLPPELST